MANQSVKVTLDNDVQINGVTIPAGVQELPADQAEDVKRIDDQYKKYLITLNRSQEINAARR